MALQIDSLQSDALVLKLLGKLHPGAHSATLYRIAAKCAASARQAAAFELTADGAQWGARPMLEYYAMLQWMKSLLHLLVLDYPPSSAVLQHGMSTRRIKRDNYRWPLESVYLYKQGVLQSFQALTGGITVGGAGGGAGPEAGRGGGLAVGPGAGRGDAESGRDAGLAAGPGAVAADRPVSAASGLPNQLVIGNLLTQVPEMAEALAWFYPHFSTEPIYPAWLTQFVLLFSLSALCRYNPVEWSDIVLWSNEIDAQLVRQFLARPRFHFQLVDFTPELR